MSDSDHPEDDLSFLADEEIASEAKREGLRGARDARTAARAQRSLDVAERVVLLSLLVFAALVAGAVVCVGLLTNNDDLVHIGLLAMGACGALLYRTRS